MHITVKWFNDNFNIGLASKEGADEFLSIKGCRIKSHEGKEFISFPAWKNAEGKWKNHVWGSDKFQAAVIELAKVGQEKPKANPRDLSDIASDNPF